MANFTGASIAAADYRQLPTDISSNVLTYAASSPTVVTEDPLAPVTGTKGDTQPVDEPQDVKTGHYIPVNFDDFYYRIILTPTVYALGNILFDSNEPVEVFNGYFVDKTLTDFSFDTSWGVTPTEPVAAPYNFIPLCYQSWDFSVALSGPATLDTDATWTIDGQTYAVNFTGNRVFLFSAPPNWKSALKETLQWKSGVLRSFDGDEQRQSLLERPRLRLEFNYLLNSQNDIATLTNKVFGWDLRTFAVPRWQDRSGLTSAASISDTVVNCATANLGFYDGGLALIYVSPTVWEVLDILTVGASSLTMELPVRNNWSAGTKVFPVYIGQLPSRMKWKKITAGVWSGRVKFEADPVQTEPYLPAASAPLTYSGQELYMKKPNWRSPISETSNSNVFISDYGFGAVQPESHSDFAEHSRRYAWLCKNRAEIALFMEFLARRKGRVVPVYMPSWDSDFELVRDAAGTENTLELRDNSYTYDIGNHPAKNTLIALRKDGTYVVCTVDYSILNSEGNMELYMVSDLGSDLYMSDISRISYCDLRRMQSDTVKLVWHTGGVLEATLNFISVKQ